MLFQSNSWCIYNKKIYKILEILQMDKIKKYLLRHPTRYKYILLIIDIFLILVATKIFINYNNIIKAIDETALESQYKELELAYNQNFQISYEKSDYSALFLKHENNILLPKEFIIKFQKIIPKEDIQEQSWSIRILKTPQESRKQFLYEKLLLKEQKKIESI